MSRMAGGLPVGPVPAELAGKVGGMPPVEVRVSATEVAHFRRLVAFLVQVEAHAVTGGDDELLDLVDAVRRDLLRLG